MDRIELEEGGAYPYPDDDENIDPGVAFSCIDERIQDVLGHYQKDFEGGVSAESLGARFGGYGSFLPAHQRSPSIFSKIKTPQEVGSHSIPRPLHNRPFEGTQQNSMVLPREILHVRHVPDSDTAPPPPISKTSMDSSLKFRSSGEWDPKESLINPYDQKMLKVRIKMGSESIMAQKNAEIYSGLGLGMSSSSSSEESPASCEENFAESQETLGESPSCIVKIMTCFPVSDGLPLSPLEDSLVHFSEEKNCPNNCQFGPVRESFSVLANELAHARGIREVHWKKKMKLRDKDRNSVEMMNENCEDSVNVIDTHSKQETQNSINKETVSSAMKLHITSNEKGKVRNAAKDTGRASKAKIDVVKCRTGALNLGKEGATELISDEQANRTRTMNAKTGLVEKVHEDKRAGLDARRDCRTKVESSYDLFKVDYDLPKPVKGLAGRTIEPAREKCDQKVPFYRQSRMEIPDGKEGSSSGGKKKLKGRQHDGRSTAGTLKESLRIGFSMAPKDKNACSSYFPAKGEGIDMKSHKDLKKVRDSRSDFVEKVKLGKKENRMDLMETPHKDGAELSKIGEAGEEINAFSGKFKERSGGKKSGSWSTFDAPLEGDQNDATSVTENGPNSDVFPAEAAPVLIEENWVCCDKCHKWRLLPYGTNPDHLPKKWLCSMINWLPGMNKCSFSEEETTNALNALYEVPVPDIRINQLSYPDGVASDVTLTSAQLLDQIPLEVGFNSVLSSGKKKQGSKAASNAGDAKLLKLKSKRDGDQDGFTVHKKAKRESMHYTNVVQNPGVSIKQARFDDQKYNEHSSPQYSLDVAKDVSLSYTEKQKNLAGKMLAREEHITREISGKNRKLKDFEDTQIYSGSPLNKTKQTTINDQKDNEYSSPRYSKDLAKDCSLVSTEKQKKQVEKIVAVEEYSKKEISSKKRKLKDCQDTQIYLEIPLRKQKERKAKESSYQVNAFSSSKELDSQDRKDKATRITLSSNRNCPMDNNIQYEISNIENDCPQGQYHRRKLSQSTLDGTSCLRNDLGSRRPSVATTSSSSKISATFNIKVNFQKVEGSPVESVSSSPLRISNPQNLSKSFLGINNATNTGISLVNSQTRFSECNCDGGSSQFETGRKEKSIHVRSLESSKFNHPSEMDAKSHCRDMGRLQNHHHLPNSSHSPKSGRGSCSRTKEKPLISNSSAGIGRLKISDSSNEQKGLHPTDSLKSERVEKNLVGRKASTRKHPSDCSVRGHPSNSECHEDPPAKSDTKWKDGKSTPEKNMLQNNVNEGPASWHPTNRVDGVASRGGKSTYFSLSRDRKEGTSQSSVPVSEKVSRPDVLSVDGSEGHDGAQAPKQLGKPGRHNEFHQTSFRHFMPSVHGLNDIDSPSPLKEDTSSGAANNALKEAKDLKHSANHLKISGSGLESTELFFQAALKFLHGASLLEPCNIDASKFGEMTSMEIYGTTAKLCEYCAHEYERCKDLASAALAYKCMEVSYMRLIYYNDFIASSDRHDLQMALQMVPSGESPSSSASDVDNLNYQAIVDKTDVAKEVDSPRFTGNHVIAARNRSHFIRLLNFAQDVNIAMEASKKSQDAFAAARVVLAEAGNIDGISSVERVLDFSFHDVERLLHLVHHAIEAIKS